MMAQHWMLAWFYKVSGPVLLRSPIFLWFFSVWAGVRTPAPPPLWIRPWRRASAPSQKHVRVGPPLNLGLKKKGFKTGHLNIQGIQNKTDQIASMLNSTENDIQLLGLSESKLKANHPSNHFAIKNVPLFRRDRILSADRPEQGEE